METRLLYLQNASCTWCWEFGPVLQRIADTYGDAIPIDVYAGESLTAGRSAVALMTMKVLDASQALAFACRLQAAHFRDKLDLVADATYEALALEFGQDPTLFINLMQHEQILDAVQAEYEFVVSMGATGFPTVIMTHGETGMVLLEGSTTFEDMELRVELGRKALVE
ncbi:MAG: hypothetical protein JSS89_05020 [Bacteroidetes bacterium]|nr:hypothetical protein [Bacteroidota bacterium]